MDKREYVRDLIQRWAAGEGLDYRDAVWLKEATGFPLLYFMRPRDREWAHVAVICATRAERGFLAALYRALWDALDKAGITYQPMRPDEGLDYSFSEHQRLRDRMLTGSKPDGCIMIVPMLDRFSQKQADDVFRFANGLAMPVVFLDLGPPRHGLALSPMIGFVGTDDVYGGKLAAREILSEARAIERLHVVCFGDRSKPTRLASVVHSLREARPDCELTICGDVGVTLASAAETTERACRRAFKENRPPDMIFAKSGRVVLGVLEGIREVCHQRGAAPPRIVTFDGLEGAPQRQIAHTVIQNPRALAEAAVEQLVLRLCNQPSSRARLLLPSTIRAPHKMIRPPGNATTLSESEPSRYEERQTTWLHTRDLLITGAPQEFADILLDRIANEWLP